MMAQFTVVIVIALLIKHSPTALLRMYTHCHLMLILPSELSQLHHIL